MALSQRVADYFEGAKEHRAIAAARTEVTRSLSWADNQAQQAAGIREKQWLTAGDEDVRDTHQDADGQIVKFGGDYLVGSATGPYPGEMSEVGENVNCRCVSAAVAGKSITPEMRAAILIQRDARADIRSQWETDTDVILRNGFAEQETWLVNAIQSV